jgi:hypothetical protein
MTNECVFVLDGGSYLNPIFVVTHQTNFVLVERYSSLVFKNTIKNIDFLWNIKNNNSHQTNGVGA